MNTTCEPKARGKLKQNHREQEKQIDKVTFLTSRLKNYTNGTRTDIYKTANNLPNIEQSTLINTLSYSDFANI